MRAVVFHFHSAEIISSVVPQALGRQPFPTAVAGHFGLDDDVVSVTTLGLDDEGLEFLFEDCRLTRRGQPSKVYHRDQSQGEP